MVNIENEHLYDEVIGRWAFDDIGGSLDNDDLNCDELHPIDFPFDDDIPHDNPSSNSLHDFSLEAINVGGDSC